MITNADSHGKEIETLLNRLNENNLLRSLPPSYRSRFDSVFTDNEDLVEEIAQNIEKAGLPTFGHTYLYDGETGQRFDQKATVGII